jgi:hypothetical protein
VISLSDLLSLFARSEVCRGAVFWVRIIELGTWDRLFLFPKSVRLPSHQLLLGRVGLSPAPKSFFIIFSSFHPSSMLLWEETLPATGILPCPKLPDSNSLTLPSLRQLLRRGPAENRVLSDLERCCRGVWLMALQAPVRLPLGLVCVS